MLVEGKLGGNFQSLFLAISDLSRQDAHLVDEEHPTPVDVTMLHFIRYFKIRGNVGLKKEHAPWYADGLIGDQVVLPVAVTSKEGSGAEEELSQLGQALNLEQLRSLLYHLQPACLQQVLTWGREKEGGTKTKTCSRDFGLRKRGPGGRQRPSCFSCSR